MVCALGFDATYRPALASQSNTPIASQCKGRYPQDCSSKGALLNPKSGATLSPGVTSRPTFPSRGLQFQGRIEAEPQHLMTAFLNMGLSFCQTLRAVKERSDGLLGSPTRDIFRSFFPHLGQPSHCR